MTLLGRMQDQRNAGGEFVARARKWIDDRGRLRVVAQGNLYGRRVRRYRIIPKNDEELADEVVRQLNVQFALGDLSFLTSGTTRVAPPDGNQARDISEPTFAEWATRWLESYQPPVYHKMLRVESV